MKKQTLLSLICAGALTVGSAAGFAGISKDQSISAKAEEQAYQLLSTATIDDVDTSGLGGSTITGVSDVAAAMLPAVVSITNKSVQEVQDLFGMYGWYGFGNGGTYSYESESCGTGFIIGQNEDELLICTNYHVIDGAQELTVGFVDDEIYKAEVKGGDSANDLAVVAVRLEDISDDTMSQIKISEIGNSDDLIIGQQVVAIGNALGYGQSVTTGIVSAMNRSIDLDGYYTQLIQTDAAINPGNSGGPLLDMNGNVIGINSAKAASSGVEGMGYAIPISYAQSIIEDLMNKKTRTETVDEDEAAYIGIVGQDVSSEMSSLYGIPEGIYITEVSEGSPAEEAGLKKGDIIVKFDGSSVTSMGQLKSMLQYYAAGETVTMVISTANEGEYEQNKVEITLGSFMEYSSN